MSRDDTFGFDELEKAFAKMEKKYPSKADALLMAQGQVAASKTRGKTPVGKTKKLKRSWQLKKVKKYGATRVVRLQTAAPHGHLVEDGHEIVTGGRARGRNTLQKAFYGVKSNGRVEGKHMLRGSIAEAESSFHKKAEKMLDDLTSEVQL